MKERPILFSDEMVRSILDGAKTQTRRVVKFRDNRHIAGEPVNDGAFEWWPVDRGDGVIIKQSRLVLLGECPYGQAGGRLWVRETWGTVRMHEIGQHVYGGRRIPDHDQVVYRAGRLVGVPPKDGPMTMDRFTTEVRDDLKPTRWRPSIHMPRKFSRITLEITGIRIERVQQITEADAIAEGCISTAIVNESKDDYLGEYASERFVDLWDSLNAKRGYSWESNPFVWILEFRRVESIP